MINYRTGAFETNSSSLHSIIVTPSTENDRVYSLDNDRTNVTYGRVNDKYVITGWTFNNGEFGRSPFEILREPKDKMLYAIADEDLTIQEAYEMAKKHNPDLQYFEFRVEEYKKMKYVKTIYLYDGQKWYKRKINDLYTTWKNAKPLDRYGIVDHQSCGLLTSFLAKKNITVEEFVYGNQYTVIIDGDEYQYIDMLESICFHLKEGVEMYSGSDDPCCYLDD